MKFLGILNIGKVPKSESPVSDKFGTIGVILIFLAEMVTWHTRVATEHLTICRDSFAQNL